MNWVHPRGSGFATAPGVYLHYVFYLWADRWRRRKAKGNFTIVRYADDIVVGFEYEADGRRFWDAMRQRLAQFALALHPDKTRLLEFGRYAAERRQQHGLGKPKTFTFFGFTHVCSKSQRGTFMLRRKSRADRMRAKLRDIKEQLRKQMHESIPSSLSAVRRGILATVHPIICARYPNCGATTHPRKRK